MAFVRRPYGRWGGGHCVAQPSHSVQCYSAHTFSSDREPFMAFPFQIPLICPVSTSQKPQASSIPHCIMEAGWWPFLHLSSHYSLNPANSQRDFCSRGSQTPRWNVQVKVSRRLGSAVSLGSQVWVINFQCCCLTSNEVMASGQD